MFDPDVRRAADGTSLAHLATVLPDGSSHTVPLWIGTHDDHIVFLTGGVQRSGSCTKPAELITGVVGGPLRPHFRSENRPAVRRPLPAGGLISFAGAGRPAVC
jgi:hypothetical protein